MPDINIKTLCRRCLGTGFDDNTLPPGPCGGCGATGYRVDDKIEVTDIMNAIADVLEKCNDIKEKVNEIKEVVEGL